MEDIKKYIDMYQSVDKFGQANNFQLTVLSPGNVEYLMKVEEKHASSPGICHGGAISGLMDATLGLAALSYTLTVQCLCSTVEFKMNFISPAKVGDTLKGIGKIEHKGKSLVITSADIIDLQTRKLMAKGIGTFNLYPLGKKEFMKDVT